MMMMMLIMVVVVAHIKGEIEIDFNKLSNMTILQQYNNHNCNYTRPGPVQGHYYFYNDDYTVDDYFNYLHYATLLLFRK